MKKTVLSIAIALFIVSITPKAYSQKCCPYIGLISISPGKPNTNDHTQIITQVTTPCLGKKINKKYYIRNDTIFLEACYFSGSLFEPETFSDTFNIGLLYLGTYSINLKASQSTKKDTCKVVDYKTKDTSISVSKAGISSIKEKTVNIYPNPASTRIYLSLKETCTSTIQITDLIGKILFTERCQLLQTNGQDPQIDISHLASGTYFVRLSSETTNQVMKINILR